MIPSVDSVTKANFANGLPEKECREIFDISFQAHDLGLQIAESNIEYTHYGVDYKLILLEEEVFRTISFSQWQTDCYCVEECICLDFQYETFYLYFGNISYHFYKHLGTLPFDPTNQKRVIRYASNPIMSFQNVLPYTVRHNGGIEYLDSYLPNSSNNETCFGPAYYFQFHKHSLPDILNNFWNFGFNLDNGESFINNIPIEFVPHSDRVNSITALHAWEQFSLRKREALLNA